MAAVDGVHLHLDRWGEAGRPVLLSHGFGQTRGAWAGTARELARRGCIAFCLDARGHGRSGRNPDGQRYRVEQFVSDIAQVAGAMPQPPVLVGASMGGLVGIAAQAAHRCFAGLVLVDITPSWNPQGVERILAFMGAHPEGFPSLEAAADAVAAYLPHRPRKSRQALTSVLRQREDGRWVWHWDPRLLADIGRTAAEVQDGLREAARSLDVPVLLVSGGRSELIGRTQVEDFLALVPHARHVRIDEATHMVAGDCNDSFTATVVSFLDELHHATAPAVAATGASS